MKYGEQFEKESVPEWSLHNIDYNSLKHYIKVHTTRDQASAIVIPGHQDVSLAKFEDELFGELSRQHDRVDMFVASKADEISRRLQHLSNQIRLLVLRSAPPTDSRKSPKRRRRFAKYEAALVQCGDEIQALQRFVNAQVIAFRKILKKYRKWTGSSALSSRFKDAVLSHPKSFTRRDFSHLQTECEDLLANLRAATPADIPDAATADESANDRSRRSSRQHQDSAPQNTQEETYENQQQSPWQPQGGYWNEYDNGSEAGDLNGDAGYTIYIDPNENFDFPGLATVLALFTMPVQKVKAWLAASKGLEPQGERGPLLPTHTDSYGATGHHGYVNSLSDSPFDDTEAEDDTLASPTTNRRGSYGYASSEDYFPPGYETYYASLPSVNDQTITHYRERVLAWGTLGGFASSFVLLGIAGVLITTGRHRLRVEVDAAVTLGVVASLGFACAALGMSLLRRTGQSRMHRAAVWATFLTVCILNGFILVLVAGNTTL